MVVSKIIQWWKVVLVLLIIRSYKYVYLKHRHSFESRLTVHRN